MHVAVREGQPNNEDVLGPFFASSCLQTCRCIVCLQGGDELYTVRTYADIVTVPDPEILQVRRYVVAGLFLSSVSISPSIIFLRAGVTHITHTIHYCLKFEKIIIIWSQILIH